MNLREVLRQTDPAFERAEVTRLHTTAGDYFITEARAAAA
jgi:hypothetical protein